MERIGGLKIKGISLFKRHTEEDFTEYGLPDQGKYVRDMKAKGYTLSQPKRNEVFLDIDSKEDFEEFLLRYENLCACTDIIGKFEVFQSRSGGEHKHVVITLAVAIDDGLRIAIQHALNSDPMREFLNTCRLCNREVYANLLVRDN